MQVILVSATANYALLNFVQQKFKVSNLYFSFSFSVFFLTSLSFFAERLVQSCNDGKYSQVEPRVISGICCYSTPRKARYFSPKKKKSVSSCSSERNDNFALAETLVQIVKRNPNKRTIVFCATLSSCDEAFQTLRKQRLNVMRIHASLKPKVYPLALISARFRE
jgi:hypothetical protein